MAAPRGFLSQPSSPTIQIQQSDCLLLIAGVWCETWRSRETKRAWEAVVQQAELWIHQNRFEQRLPEHLFDEIGVCGLLPPPSPPHFFFFFNQGNKFQAKYCKAIFNYSLKCNYLSYQPCGFLFAALIWQLVVCNFWKAYTLQESVIFMLLKVEMLN